MRIGVFGPLRSPWSRQAALRLAELGNEVHFIDFASPGAAAGYTNWRDEVFHSDVTLFRKQMAGIHIFGTRLYGHSRYVTCAPVLHRTCRRYKIDVLLALWGGGWATMSFLSGVRPYAVFVGGGDILRVAGINRWISAYALRKAAIVFANGRYFGAKAQDFAPGAKIYPLYYGVDNSRFYPVERPVSPIGIICTRGFRKAYNNAYVIEALARMPRDLPQYRVIFTSPGELLEEVRLLADRILPEWVRPHIEFLNGVTDDEMVRRVQSSSVYVSMSRTDGTSISLLEALSCGLFPVLSSIPQNQEWIDPALCNGLLVPLDEPEALTEALVKALCDEQMRSRAGLVNRQIALDRADGHKNMAILAGELEKVVASRPRNGGAQCL
jgi:glycosyltransferase involved in cell wall biosynthesis